MCLGSGGSSIIPIIADVAAVASGNPEAIAAAAATTAGNYIQTQQNNKNTSNQWNARNDALAQGYQKEEGLQSQANDAFTSTLAPLQPGPANQTLGDIVASRAATINGNTNAVPSTGTNGPEAAISTAPQVVQSQLGQALSGATQYGQQQGNALAALGATGDQFLNQNIGIQQGAANIGNIANTAKADAGVTTAQAESAFNNARGSPSELGQLLSTAGMIGGIDSVTGGNGLGALFGSGSGAGAATNAVVNAANTANKANIATGLVKPIQASQIAQPGWMTD